MTGVPGRDPSKRPAQARESKVDARRRADRAQSEECSPVIQPAKNRGSSPPERGMQLIYKKTKGSEREEGERGNKARARGRVSTIAAEKKKNRDPGPHHRSLESARKIRKKAVRERRSGQVNLGEKHRRAHQFTR